MNKNLNLVHVIICDDEIIYIEVQGGDYKELEDWRRNWGYSYDKSYIENSYGKIVHSYMPHSAVLTLP